MQCAMQCTEVAAELALNLLATPLTALENLSPIISFASTVTKIYRPKQTIKTFRTLVYLMFFVLRIMIHCAKFKFIHFFMSHMCDFILC